MVTTFETCPGPDALITEAEGYGLESTRRHLVTCARCRRAVQNLREFPNIEPDPGVKPLTEEEIARSWERCLDALQRMEEN